MRDITPQEFLEIEKVASKAAAKYARRVFWADREDLKQEALLAALKAVKRSYDPTTGVPVGGYAWRAAVLHLRNWCWRNGSPVSAPSEHSVTKLRGLHRRSWTAPVKGLGRPLIETHAGPKATESEYGTLEWNAKVREQVLFLIDDSILPDNEKQIAKRVLLNEEEHQVVAAEVGVPNKSVWRIARKARVMIESNYMLFNYWKEL